MAWQKIQENKSRYGKGKLTITKLAIYKVIEKLLKKKKSQSKSINLFFIFVIRFITINKSLYLIYEVRNIFKIFEQS
jgi:hypothetical protein